MIPKYKVWDKTTNRMNELITIDFINECLFYRDPMYGMSYGISFDEVELLQSTGLKDKHGTEIFEGDVVKHDLVPNPFYANTNFEIVQARTGEWRIDNFRGGSVLAFCNHKVEIIGDKFTHPHLLEE